jgi:hypothetical protein
VAIAPNATNNELNRIPSKEIGSIFKLDTCNHLIKEGLVQSIHLSSKQNDVKILLDWFSLSQRKLNLMKITKSKKSLL